MIVSSVVLVGCTDPGYKNVTSDYASLPEELKDCQFYRVNDRTSMLRVVRCPNSTTSTTYQSGRQKRTSVVIDGVTYYSEEETR